MLPPPASAGSSEKSAFAVAPPAVTLPKGGGAIRGMGEKFGANPVTGTGSLSVPIATSPGRSGFGPQLSLAYDSGAGNGAFGLGWNLSLPSITRKTDKGLPRYQDAGESDVFILSGEEDLVPVLVDQGGDWRREQLPDRTLPDGGIYAIQRYRPRIEGLFARIERWTDAHSGEVHWRSITKDNVTTLYGKTSESRIADPADPARVFSWLICESHDDKGNAIRYQYKQEDSAGVDPSLSHEANRTQQSRSANRYLKRIQYGNKTPQTAGEDLSARTDWLFEAVFDYGEHYTEDSNGIPTVFLEDNRRPWDLRQDPFSSYRAGFEVRSYRLCRRVLMFHHFPAELGIADCLVRATHFNYREGTIASFITSATQSGYVRKPNQGGTFAYLKQSLPPLEFEYSEARIQESVEEIDAQSLENLPQGLDGTAYQWVDLDGEGLSGILTEQSGAWFYKRNLSSLPLEAPDGTSAIAARFAPVERLETMPSPAELRSGRQQFLDLAGDGQLDVVELDSPTPGYFERTQDEGWESHVPFSSLPNLSWQDPNLRFVDLTGDGHADVFVTEDEVFTWYPSLAKAGFGPAEQVRKVLDEEQGPRLVFADGTQSIYLSDMSGDGLTDLVRIRNGEVCYWPNLGYGRFGAKVTMANAPRFDTLDQFDQRRIRLADTDGSGVTDILYLGRDGVSIYLNESGNRWSDARKLEHFPRIDDLSSVMAVDLLGNGTACLVWSSPLPGDARRSMRYVDLMGGQKPHLLVKTRNNLGAETHVHYAPSTKFYLADKLAGRPWITRLPFPVHVVERVETYDRVSRNRFVTRYAYHHGYFDGEEREFRGFGMVEQWDTEELAALTAAGELPAGDNIDAASHVPPVHTKSWFHTGVYLGRDRVSNFFAGLLDTQDRGEYYREPAWRDDDVEARKRLLADTVLPGGLTLEEEREACRALKGMMLRQEVYALDGTEKAAHPYTVTEQNFAIAALQPRGANRHAVFFTHAREAISYHYERNPADPRTTHALTLEVDAFGNVLKSAAVAYGRRQPDTSLPGADQLKQIQTLITYTENRVTNAVVALDDYRTPLPCEASTYELTGHAATDPSGRFRSADFLQPNPGGARRLIEHLRTLYRKNDLTGFLALGTLESLALPGESYKLAFTPGLLTSVYGSRVTNGMLEDEGRYVHSEADANWWIPSGRIFFSPDAATEELAHARQHFFLPHRYRDPFHTNAVRTESFIAYDVYDLLIAQTRDALDNVVTVATKDDTGNTANRIDYRVLQPYWVTDPNGNRTAVAFDALGMVVGTAVMGKPAPVEGDSLTGFEADLTEAVILDHLQSPLVDPQAILQRATTRLVYDLFAYERTKDQPDPQPAVVYTLARETHDSEPVSPGELKIQHSFSYSDGFGREIQKKIQAEPGPVSGRVGEVSPRWVGSGWTVFNNKGKPVRQYEPFFTDTHRFEFDVRVGVSPVLFYDPVERVVATLHPNHTWEKVVFDPWRQETWDVSDTVLAADPKTDVHVSDFFRRLPDADYLPSWHTQREAGALGAQEQTAARKAAIHANTPSVAHADCLGRAFLTVAHNKFKYGDTLPADPPIQEFHRTRVLLDIEGNQREVVDAKDRVVMRYDYDLLGNRIHQASMEAGARSMLNDVAGKPLYAWDSRNHRFRTAYDALRRPTDSFLAEGTSAELLVGRAVYGETRSNPENNNLRGKVIQLFDQAGLVTSDEYDFKGNLLRSQRELAQAYKTTLDWSADVPLQTPPHISRTRYDALNRPTELTAPDNSVIRPGYNEANLLERVEANLRGAQQNGQPVWTPFVTDIDYNAKGQRTQIAYGNGVTTTYTYDPLTFRLVHLLTRRDALAFPDDCPQAPPTGWPGCQVQNLHYTYDPADNITHIRDDAQQTIYFKNQRVEPSNDYTYDALYRLIEATGREHLGQAGAAPAPSSYNDKPRVGILFSASDGNAMARYLQRYVYDEVGNFLEMIHRGTDLTHPGWTRAYAYDEPSLLEPGKPSNRLTSTTIGATTETYSTGGNGYDAHGNMLRMPHLGGAQPGPNLHWDYKDQLRQTNLGGGGTAYYVYDASGQRVRKVWEKSENLIEERIYLGGFEIFRRHGGAIGANTATLERETLHIMDDKQRIALVETRTLDAAGNDPAPQQLIRHQFSNHLGSASLELDDQAQIISYEEYTPYGNTSYEAVRSQTDTPKRYRYTGKERDEESGLYYHGARYYAPWLGRWTSPDPTGFADGANLYGYARHSPISRLDIDGRQSTSSVSSDIWAGIRGIPLSLVEPLSTLEDVMFMGVVMAFGGEVEIDAIAPYMSATSQRLVRAELEGASAFQKARIALLPAASIGTAGAAALVDNSVRVFEEGMSPDEAQSFLTQSAVTQVGLTGIAMGLSKTTGSGWTGRAPTAIPEQLQAGADALIQERAAIEQRAVEGKTGKAKEHALKETGNATLGKALDREGPVAESVENQGPHAEMQLDSRLMIVDQTTCSNCQATFRQGELLNSVRTYRLIDPSKPSRSSKTAAQKAARGKGEVVAVDDFVMHMKPPLGAVAHDIRSSLESRALGDPTPAEIEAQQSLPEPDRYR